MFAGPRRGPPCPGPKKTKINNRSLFWKALETSGLIFPILLLLLLLTLLLLVLFRSSPWHYVVGPGARYWEARIPREQPQFPPSFSHWCPALELLLLLVLLMQLLLLFAAAVAVYLDSSGAAKHVSRY